MTKNKLALQSQLANVLALQLETRGYTSDFDGEVYTFTRTKGEALWRLTYYLTGDSCYSAFMKLILFYPRMEAIIRSLPVNEEFKTEMKDFGIATSTLVGVYWDDARNESFYDSSAIPEYADALLLAIDRAEREFAEPNSDLDKPVREATLFYTKWPKNMGPLMTGMLLIAAGLDSQRYDLTRIGVERIKNKIDFAQTERWQSFMLAVASAAEVELKKRAENDY